MDSCTLIGTYICTRHTCTVYSSNFAFLVVINHCLPLKTLVNTLSSFTLSLYPLSLSLSLSQHIARLSYVEISPETVLGPPPPGPEHDVPQEVPQEVPREVPQDPLEEVVQSPSTHDTSRDTSVISYSPSPPPPPLSLPPEDDAFMDTQI